jgi:hypothetical protein
MEPSLRPHNRVQRLIGFGVAAAACVVAATVSAATAPTAHADDFSDIIATAEDDFANGQSAFELATTDFGASDPIGGLTAVLEGVDDDLLAAPDNLVVGTVEALTNEGISGNFVLLLPDPANFADGISAADGFISQAEGFASDSTLAFSSGDYGDGLLDSLLASDYAGVLPAEEILLGSLASLGL